ncbi:MAG: SLATT domain-containing protein [Undibacterium sp.]|nr:SLATT domain-containing protein [Undibacterium sp.]
MTANTPAPIKETPVEHLLRSLQITATSRFFAAKRFRSHESWSLWAISIASLLLIFIPLFKPFGLQIYLSDGLVNVAQVLSAAIILVFSLLVNGSKYGERAEMMHSCALSINSISRRLEYHIHTNTAEVELAGLRTEYENLLEKHENHSDHDFLRAQIRKFSKYYNVDWKKIAKAYIYDSFSYSAYVLLILVQVAFIWLMVVNPKFDPIRRFIGIEPCVASRGAPN